MSLRVQSASRRFGRSSFASAAVVAVGLATGAAHAGDGVVEINHASALQGVGLGDLPGYPVTLSLRGSYRLTGELNVPPDTSGIVLQNDQIELDLNGFSIVGGGNAGGYGVYTPAPTTRGQRVSNGTIRSFHSGGVLLGQDSVAQDLVVIGTGGAGIEVGESSRVLRCTSADNAGHGIYTATGSRVMDSIARANGADGIRVSNSVVDGSVANDNGLDGINAMGASPVRNNTVRSNGNNGIQVLLGPVLGNAISDNAGLGLSIHPTGGYGQNVLFGNNSGMDQTSFAIEIGTNVCSTNTTCP